MTTYTKASMAIPIRCGKGLRFGKGPQLSSLHVSCNPIKYFPMAGRNPFVLGCIDTKW